MRLLKLDKNIIEKIDHEIFRINKLFDSGKPLLDLCKLKEPDFVEASAAGSFLQSLYNGIESIILLIFKSLKENIPNDIHWHKNYLKKHLKQMRKGLQYLKLNIKSNLLNIFLFGIILDIHTAMKLIGIG